MDTSLPHTDTQKVCLLDMPGSTVGRYGRTQRRYLSQSHEKSLFPRKRDEVIRKCTETPLKARQSGNMSENREK